MTKLRDGEWIRLDPTKSDYQAIEGARVNGITLLLWADGRVTVTGVCSCGSKESAEQIARSATGPNAGIDRRISEKTLLSWKLPL